MKASAADIIKIAILNIQAWLDTNNLKTKMILHPAACSRVCPVQLADQRTLQQQQQLVQQVINGYNSNNAVASKHLNIS